MAVGVRAVSAVAVLAAVLIFSNLFVTFAGAQVIGVNYGTNGDNLPPPADVINLLKSRNVGLVRIFDPNHGILDALRGSGIQVVLGTLNQDLSSLAGDPNFAGIWVQTHVVPYRGSVTFRYIVAGNEAITSDLAHFVLGAMQNLAAALTAAGFSVPVSTSVPMNILGSSYPPSSGVFSDAVGAFMVPIAHFLASKNYPLLANVYPYFAFSGDPAHVPVDYALFTATQSVVQDGSLSYYNLLDAMVDAIYAALEKAGEPAVSIVLSETGWPSAGDDSSSSVAYAGTYNENAVRHVTSGNGTPRRPGRAMETYLFAMFNEDLKPEGIERNFGLYYPNKTEVYHVDL